MNKP
jgi:hypothetical protein